ncbi:hypothetical protein GCM10009123_18370 [Kangiella japonica]|uniref:DUF2489 domain-containing protein n=1 Tax=Kangiella japonica TaxID=647384 RepID=A0ABN0T3N2_9GAMM
MTIFYYIASAIIIILAVYAAFLLIQLRRQKKLLGLKQNDFSLNHSEQIASVVDSIVSISKAMQQEQCPTIEGCIRLKVLIDQLRLDEVNRKPFEVFYTVYDKTSHIPTHEAWGKLEKRQKMAYTLEMNKIEVEHQEEIKKAVDTTVEKFSKAKEPLYTNIGSS